MPLWKKIFIKKKKKTIKKTTNIPTPTKISQPKIISKPSTPKSEPPKQKTSITVPIACNRHDNEKAFLKTFRELTCRHKTAAVWEDFVLMFACSISNAVDKEHYDERENRYLNTIKKYQKRDQELFPRLCADVVVALELNQEQDFLGKMFTDLNIGERSRGQFFTPYNICQLMAETTIGDVTQQVKEKGYITINDPCCGAGATLIAGIHAARKKLEKEKLNYQNHVLVAAQDIDETVALMCYIQLSLLGVAAYVKVGNSLTEPIANGDDLHNYWFTPMYFSDVWSGRRLLEKVKELSWG